MAEAAQPRAARRSVAPDWLAVGSKIHLLYMKKKGKNKGDEVWYNAEVLKHRGGPNHKKGKDPPLEVLVNFDNGLIEEEEWFAEADWPTKLRDREWRRKEKVAELAARAEERKKEKEERKAEKDIKAVEKKKEQKEQKEQEALEEKERTRKKLEEPRESEVKELLALAGADADKLSAEQFQALLRHPTRKKRKKEGGDDIEGGGDIPAGLEVPGRKRLWKGAKEQLDDPRDAGKQGAWCAERFLATVLESDLLGNLPGPRRGGGATQTMDFVGILIENGTPVIHRGPPGSKDPQAVWTNRPHATVVLPHNSSVSPSDLQSIFAHLSSPSSSSSAAVAATASKEGASSAVQSGWGQQEGASSSVWSDGGQQGQGGALEAGGFAETFGAAPVLIQDSEGLGAFIVERRAARSKPAIKDEAGWQQQGVVAKLEEDGGQNGDCVICLEGARTHLVAPCGHLALCGACVTLLGDSLSNCPVCNVPAREAIRVFHP